MANGDCFRCVCVCVCVCVGGGGGYNDPFFPCDSLPAGVADKNMVCG